MLNNKSSIIRLFVKVPWGAAANSNAIRYFTLVRETVIHTSKEVKSLPAMQETQVQSLGQGRSPGGGNGNPLQHACLRNPMDRRAWQAAVHRITKSQIPLSN